MLLKRLLFFTLLLLNPLWIFSATYTSFATGNWNSASTWTKNLTGSISVSNNSTTVTGNSTLFLTELSVGDVIQTISGSAIGTVSSITSNTSLTLTSNNSGNKTSVAYGKRAIPDNTADVVIAGAGLTVTLNATVTVSSLTINAASSNGTNQLSIDAFTLTVSNNVSVNGSLTGQRFGKIVYTNASGILNVAGNLTIGSGGNASTAVFDMSNGANLAGTLKVAGILSRNTLDGVFTAGTGSTVDFTGTNSQTINLANFVYANLSIDNTSASGASPGANITSANVTGNISVQSGTLNNGGFAITLASNKSFTVSSGATFILSGTTSAMVSVSGTGTKTFGSSSTVNYNGSGAQTITAENYGNLTSSSTGARTLASSGTIGVAGTFTQGTNSYTITGSTIDFNGSGFQTIPAFNYNNLTSSSSGARTLASSGSVGVAGTFTPGTNSFTITGSTVDFNGGSSQTIPAFNYNNLTSSSTGSRTLVSSGTIGIAGTFTQGSNSYTITGSTVDFNGSGSQTIPAFNYNNLTSSSSGSRTLASSGTIGVAGTYTYGSNTYTITGSTVNFNGSSSQTITGSTTATFNNFTISNSSGVSLSVSISVAGTLSFSSGVITTGSNKVTITSAGSVSGAGASKFVYGSLEKNVATGSNVARTYEIGYGTTDYLPISLSFASVSVAGNITAKVSNGDHPNISSSCIDDTKSVNRYWTLSNSGTTFTNYSATCNFIGVSSDADAGSTTSNYYAAIYNASAWTMLTQGSTSSTSNQATGITTMGDIQVGEKAAPKITSQPSDASACITNTATFSVTATGIGLTYQWQEDRGSGFSNLSNAGIYNNVTTATLSFNVNTLNMDQYKYRCIVSSTCGTSTTSNAATLTVNANTAVNVSIAASPSSTICSGTNVTFTATPTNGGTSPTYQWQLNGSNVGSNSTTYSNSGLANGDAITCIMTSNIACPVGNPKTSNTITMTVNPNLPVSVSIAASPSSTICSGANVTFTATPTNGGAGPSYQWQLNGSNVGTNSTTYSNSGLANGDVITCVLTSNASPCATGSPATSNSVTMTVNPNLPVSVSIAASPSGTICSGTNVTFTATPTNGGAGPSYQWQVNGSNVGTNSTTYSNSSLANGDAITCILTSNVTCPTGNPATSNTITQSVNVTGTWLGITSTDWNTAGNWCGGVPATTTNVVIQSGTPFAPTLTASSDCKDITIASGVVVSLNGKTLNVYGAFSGLGILKGSSSSSLNIAAGSGAGGTFYLDQSASGTSNNLQAFTLNRSGASIVVGNSLNISSVVNIVAGTLNTNNNLTLVSNATGTARIAELAAGADVTGNVTMQRYISSGTTGWMLLGAPVTGATLQQWDDDFVTGGFPGSQNPSITNPSIVTYDETLPGIYDDGYVTPTNITDPITALKGYWAYILTSSAINIDVTGSLIKNTQTFPVTYTNDASQPASENGWNLISNPFPSTIDWDAAGWTKTNVNDAIYGYNPTLDQYTSYVGGIGINGGSNYIASSQGFLVQTNASGPVLKVTESAKVAVDQSFIRSPQTITDDVLKLDLTGNGYNDETVVRFNSNASKNFDDGLDAMKFFSFNSSVPGMGTIANNKGYSINALPLLTSNIAIPLKVQVGVSGTYTLHLDPLTNISPNVCLMLEDLLTGTTTDLHSASSYSFNIKDTTVAPRFIIHICSPSITTSVTEQKGSLNDHIKVTSNDNTIGLIFDLNESTNTTINVYNFIGQQIVTKLNAVAYKNTIPLDFTNQAHGIYYIKIQAGDQMVVKKMVR